MRIAVVSDIHGNLKAFEAVVRDIRTNSPDLVVHAGDLADAGSSPVEIIDRIQDLGWLGVLGNTDEMLVRPETLETFASQSSAPPVLWDAIRDIASATCAELGQERLAWLSTLPMTLALPGVAIVHAMPESCWRAPAASASAAELDVMYGPLGQAFVVFGHTHLPSIQCLEGRLKFLINSGSVGLPYDGDPRASYLLIDEGKPAIRRVEYSVEDEIKALSQCGLPGAEWTVKMLRTSRPQMP
jgi:predicted phosphodiesterase